MTLPEEDKGNSEIERMWAQKRVARLLDGERGGQASNREEIVRLCEGYSIVSPYASMLVLENDAEYKRWKIEQRNATRIQRDRKSRETLQARLADMRKRASDDFEVNRPEKLVSTPTDTDNAGGKAPQRQSSDSTTAEPAGPAPTNRGVDLEVDLPGGGGGAIEPVTALLSLGAAGAAAFAHRRRKRSEF